MQACRLPDGRAIVCASLAAPNGVRCILRSKSRPASSCALSKRFRGERSDRTGDPNPNLEAGSRASIDGTVQCGRLKSRARADCVFFLLAYARLLGEQCVVSASGCATTRSLSSAGNDARCPVKVLFNCPGSVGVAGASPWRRGAAMRERVRGKDRQRERGSKIRKETRDNKRV